MYFLGHDVGANVPPVAYRYPYYSVLGARNDTRTGRKLLRNL